MPRAQAAHAASPIPPDGPAQSPQSLPPRRRHRCQAGRHHASPALPPQRHPRSWHDGDYPSYSRQSRRKRRGRGRERDRDREPTQQSRNHVVGGLQHMLNDGKNSHSHSFGPVTPSRPETAQQERHSSSAVRRMGAHACSHHPPGAAMKAALRPPVAPAHRHTKRRASHAPKSPHLTPPVAQRTFPSRRTPGTSPPIGPITQQRSQRTRSGPGPLISAGGADLLSRIHYPVTGRSVPHRRHALSTPSDDCGGCPTSGFV